MPLLLYCTSLFVTHLYRIAIERAYAKLHRPYGNYGFSKATVDYTGSLPTCWPGTHKGWSSITGTILQVPHLASASSQEWYGFVQHPPRNFGNSSGPVDNDRQPTYTSPSGPLPAAPRAEWRRETCGTGALGQNWDVGRSKSVKRRLPDLCLAFGFYFLFSMSVLNRTG